MENAWFIAVVLLALLVPIAVLVYVITLLMAHIGKLENKLMARDLTEYNVQTKDKIGNSPNFIKESMRAAYKERGEKNGG